MLDLLSEDNALPDVVEQTAWEARSGILSDLPPISIEDFSGKVMMFYGGATEMVPSLADRGGWRLVLHRSEPRYLNIHHAGAGIGKLSDHIDYFVLNDPFQGPPVGDAPGLARALVNLANNPAVKEIAAGSRLDPVSIGEMVRAVCSLLETIEAPSASPWSGGSAAERSDANTVPGQMTANTAFLDSLPDNSDSAQMSVDADRLAEEFLSSSGSIEKNQDIISAVEALIERHAERHPGNADDWAGQLSEKLSRFTD